MGAIADESVGRNGNGAVELTHGPQEPGRDIYAVEAVPGVYREYGVSGY